MKSVNEVRKLAGISRRTLQYYDEIGLLPPNAVKKSGYRLYDNKSLRRLWNILFYKELGLSLDNIRLLLENPKEMERKLLLQHKQILMEKQSQLQKMMLSVDRILNDDFDISMLRDFDRRKIEEVKRAYAKEIRVTMENNFFLPVIKSGVFPGNKTLIKNASKMMHLDLGELIVSCTEVAQKFRSAMINGPNSVAAKEAVSSYKDFINELFPCDATTFHKIGQAYLDYKDELSIKEPGLAEFVSAAILHIYP